MNWVFCKHKKNKKKICNKIPKMDTKLINVLQDNKTFGIIFFVKQKYSG